MAWFIGLMSGTSLDGVDAVLAQADGNGRLASRAHAHRPFPAALRGELLALNRSGADELHRAALASPATQHTALTNLFTGRPARGILNRVMRELGPISAAAPAFPLATAAMTALRTRAEALGSADFSPLWSGQNASGCRRIGATDLTLSLAAGFNSGT